MSGSREQILALSRAALSARGQTPEVPREYRGAGFSEMGRAEMLARFEARLRAYGAGIRRSVADALEAHGARRVALAPGVELDLAGVEVARDDPPLGVGDLDAVDGVITGCALAIAETGTIVLDGGAASGRRALSLVPDLHVCLVDHDAVVASVPDGVAALVKRGLHTAPLTFVSGPSATSDIGFERVEGVHGPRRLEVVITGSG